MSAPSSDLRGLDGNDLRRQRCEDCHAKLHEIVGDPRSHFSAQFSLTFEGSGSVAEKMSLEGIVSQCMASVYRGSDSKS